mgnify:CR=1 FL=1
MKIKSWDVEKTKKILRDLGIKNKDWDRVVHVQKTKLFLYKLGVDGTTKITKMIHI